MPLEPFKGLRPFYEEDAEYFCGRDEDVETVMNMLLVHRLTILHGVAGVGKKSFLWAGVVPAMKQETKRNWECWGSPELGIVVFPKTEDPQAWLHEPLRNLKDEIGKQMRAVGVDCFSLGPDESLGDFLKAIATRLNSPHGIGRLYLILDQFERCLHEEETDVMNNNLLTSFVEIINREDIPVHTLIALPSSDISKLKPLERFIPRFWDHRYELKHLDKEAATQAILEPIRRYNAQRPNHEAVALEEEESFVLKLLKDIGAESHDRGGLSAAWKIEAPYLQLVMQRLWQKEGIPEQSHVIRLITYDSLEGTKGIVQEHVDQTMAQLDQTERDMAARTLHQLLISARPARIDELVRRANDSVEDWQPKLREKEVEQLITGHLAPSRIVRPLANGEYESFLHTLREPLGKWVRRQQQLDRLPQEFASAEEKFKRSQIDGLRQAERAASFALREIQRHKVSASEVPTPLLIGSLKRMLNEVVESRRITDPDSPLNSMSYSPDGKWFAAASFNGRVHLLNRENGGEERLIEDPNGSVLCVTLGPDERVALASGHGYARILDFDGKVLNQFPKEPATYPYYSAGFSANGERLATGSMDGVARIWDIDGDQCIAECRGHELTISRVAFCPTQPILLTESWDGTVRLWNANTGKQICVYQVEGKFIYHGSISERGDRVATVCWLGGPVHIWNLGDKKPWREFQTHKKNVSHICFFHDPEGRQVATVSWDGTASVWVVEEKSEAEKKRVFRFVVRASRYLWACLLGEGRFPRQSYLSPEEPKKSYHFVPGPMFRACFSPDGRQLATNQWDGVVHLWTLVESPQAKGQEDPLLVLQTPSPQMCATFSPDGDQIAIVGLDKKIRLYSVRDKKIRSLSVRSDPHDESRVKPDLLEGDPEDSLHGGPLSCVAFDPNPSRIGGLATASYDRTGRLWFLDGDVLYARARLKGHKHQIYEIAYNPQEEVVATASGDGTVRFWNLSGKERTTARFEGVGVVYSAKFHPKENVVASAWNDGSIRLIDLFGKQIGKYPIHRISDSSSPAFCVDFSGDGRFLGAVFGNGTACAWECRERDSPDTWLEREPRCPPFQAHEEPAIGIAFSPSPPGFEPWFATSSMDGLVRLWSLNGRKLAEFKQHESVVRGIDFHPNPADLRLLTASLDGTVKLLKIDHGIESLQNLHRQARKWLGD
jgi:WD40 repeat protein